MHIEANQNLCVLAIWKELVIWDLSQGRRVGSILTQDSNPLSCKLRRRRARRRQRF